MSCWYLVCLCAALPGSLAICSHPSGDCIDDTVEDASILLQRHALASNIQHSQNDELATELDDQLLEDELDLDLEYEDGSLTAGNGSKHACFACKRSLGGRKNRRAMIGQCRKDVMAANNGTRPPRGAIGACIKKIFSEKCKDDCTYGTPCEQCKRALSRQDLRDVTKKCMANYSASMKKLCVDDCSGSQGFHFMENEESEDVMTYSNDERAVNGSGGCHNCIRRDHNFHVLRECSQKFGNDTIKRLTCVGDGILSKCKEKCIFSTPCEQCKRNAIISRKTMVIRAGRSKCLDAGSESFCADDCSSSLIENEQWEDSVVDFGEADVMEESREYDADDMNSEDLVNDGSEEQLLEDES